MLSAKGLGPFDVVRICDHRLVEATNWEIVKRTGRCLMHFEADYVLQLVEAKTSVLTVLGLVTEHVEYSHFRLPWTRRDSHIATALIKLKPGALDHVVKEIHLHTGIEFLVICMNGDEVLELLVTEDRVVDNDLAVVCLLRRQCYISVLFYPFMCVWVLRFVISAFQRGHIERWQSESIKTARQIYSYRLFLVFSSDFYLERVFTLVH